MFCQCFFQFFSELIHLSTSCESSPTKPKGHHPLLDDGLSRSRSRLHHPLGPMRIRIVPVIGITRRFRPNETPALRQRVPCANQVGAEGITGNNFLGSNWCQLTREFLVRSTEPAKPSTPARISRGVQSLEMTLRTAAEGFAKKRFRTPWRRTRLSVNRLPRSFPRSLRWSGAKPDWAEDRRPESYKGAHDS